MEIPERLEPQFYPSMIQLSKGHQPPRLQAAEVGCRGLFGKNHESIGRGRGDEGESRVGCL